MKHLSALNKFFWKYRFRLSVGIFFVISSNYFAVIGPEITGFLVSDIQQRLTTGSAVNPPKGYHDKVVNHLIEFISKLDYSASSIIAVFCIIILLVALIRGALMFLMRQTIIVMSRHIEFDLKNEVFQHYQKLDLNFFRQNKTGDLMSRITEDISRVRMYAGPAIMYLTNLTALIIFCVINMWRKSPDLTLMVLAPLPILAVTIYFVNRIIHKRSEKVQALLSRLTTNAQEAYSGIRVIKSFVQEKAMHRFFKQNSAQYRSNAVALAKIEALYFPSMALLIGISTLTAVYFGAKMAIADPSKIGLVVEFVIYINMLSFPVSSIGWVASMIQRASASQKRINEFLHTIPAVQANESGLVLQQVEEIEFKDVDFYYPNTGFHALRNFNLSINKGEKVLVLGRTGSGKTTVAQLLLRFYDVKNGSIIFNKKNIQDYSVRSVREKISYVPQDVFLFSDTVLNNIVFGSQEAADEHQAIKAANHAAIDDEIKSLNQGYQTLIGERGVMLSGGQKQRISIARALLKNAEVFILDDSLSAVDANTERVLLGQLQEHYHSKTFIIISHRIFRHIKFDKIIYLKDGAIAEEGTHENLMKRKGFYASLYEQQAKMQDGYKK